MLIEIQITAKVVPLLLAGWLAVTPMMTTIPLEQVNKAVVYVSGYWQYYHDGQPTTGFKGRSPFFQYPEYEWEGAIYEEPSKYGINDGRVNKLWIRKDDKQIVSYDRGWDIKPKTEVDKQILQEVLDKIEQEGIGKEQGQ